MACSNSCGFCYVSAAAQTKFTIRSISNSTAVSYTIFSKALQRKKTKRLKSGELGGCQVLVTNGLAVEERFTYHHMSYYLYNVFPIKFPNMKYYANLNSSDVCYLPLKKFQQSCNTLLKTFCEPLLYFKTSKFF